MIIPLNKEKISESDLIGTTLIILAKAQANNLGPLKTAQIKEVLSRTIPLKEADKAPLKNRKDDAFSQIVRNFTSHNTLEKVGFAKRYTKANNDEGFEGYVITDKGKAHLLSLLVASSDMANSLLPEENRREIKKTPTNAPQFSERDIVESALLVLAQAEILGYKTVSTSLLKSSLQDLLPLSFSDLLPLKNRNDHVFTQTVRNFTSHNTLEKAGVAKRYTPVNNTSNLSGYQLTMKGKMTLLDTILEDINDPQIKSMAELKEIKDFAMNNSKKTVSI